ncbi:hypothetical protein MU1_06900 [Paenibacillus glycanilyticus]|uniref:NodB homology domain-containing protein n=1 Tax=Paenibacillus glycanilyticus TaxID=126569 RepID=A0ABQ6G5U5_9BACL|nr:hypothetical protein MU1_06900 [Paenibacillus glycanilyticus]
MSRVPDFGAFVISIDFELLWGMRDIITKDSPYAERMRNEKIVIPRMLELFEEYEISATWATVGMLFARSRSEFLQYAPTIKPQYLNNALNPYQEEMGEGEGDDPLHYAPLLIKQIRNTPRQEIATHTYSHYYCLEKGQNSQAFEADLISAIQIAQKQGIQLKSIVFPRNQHNPEYDELLIKHGVQCFRGNEQHRIYRPRSGSEQAYRDKAYRLADSYLNLTGNHLIRWEDVVEPSGLCNIPASRFFRPYMKQGAIFEKLKVARMTRSIKEAARSSRIYHLWWHPHNFGGEIEDNLAQLRDVLACVSHCKKEYGMQSLSMREAADLAEQYKYNNSLTYG